jgi:3-oxoacyl-[acyl-carrier protein] reductase
MADRFAGRVALVTGAAQGIGLGIARRLVEDGATVVLADRNPETLQAATAELGGQLGRERIQARVLDVTDGAEVTQTVAGIARDLGPVEVLVNNAGIIRDGWVDGMTDEAWDAVIAVNLTGAFHCCRAVVPTMKERQYGRIVNIASRAWMGNPGQANYSASKAGLVGLTRALALELVKFGITVNAIAPGMIDTPMARSLKPEVLKRLVAAQPGGRMGTIAEVASVVTYLASEEASFVTGQVVNVCGGKSLGMRGVA